MERRVGNVTAHPQQRQPLPGQRLLAVRDGLINADRIEKAGEYDVAHAAADAVVKMQAATDIADMLLNIPDGFSTAPTAAKQRQVVTVSLGVIAGYQAEKGRLSGAIRADYLPVLAASDLPAEAVQDRTVVIRDRSLLIVRNIQLV